MTAERRVLPDGEQLVVSPPPIPAREPLDRLTAILSGIAERVERRSAEETRSDDTEASEQAAA